MGEAVYTFEIYTADTEFNNVGAVYFFTRRNDNSGSHSLLYIGQSGELGAASGITRSGIASTSTDAIASASAFIARRTNRPAKPSKGPFIAECSTPCNDE